MCHEHRQAEWRISLSNPAMLLCLTITAPTSLAALPVQQRITYTIAKPAYKALHAALTPVNCHTLISVCKPARGLRSIYYSTSVSQTRCNASMFRVCHSTDAAFSNIRFNISMHVMRHCSSMRSACRVMAILFVFHALTVSDHAAKQAKVMECRPLRQ